MNYIEYLNFIIYYGLDTEKMRAAVFICDIYLKDQDEEPAFREITSISKALLLTRFKGKDIESLLSRETIARAKARISLHDFEKGREYIKNFRLEENLEEIELPDDETIKKKLLSALLNIRRTNPATYRRFDFEKEGFCQILGINRGRFNFIKDLLLEQEYINETDSKSDLNENYIYITAKGYEQIESLSKRVVTMKGADNTDKFEYDVVISFAGEDRIIAEAIVKELELRKITYFYDNENIADLWGKDLYSHLSYIYGKAGKFCIMLLSENYAKKQWTNHERSQAQARAFREKREYILPIRLDETEIPGIAETIGYIDYGNTTPADIANSVLIKLNKLSL